MGFLTGSKKTIVSSVVYNLAGEVADRPDFLKTTVVGSVMSDTSSTLGEDLNRSYLNGPGIGLRSFGRWARTSGYSDFMGVMGTDLTLKQSVNVEVVADNIPHGSDETPIVQRAEIGVADYSYWADQYMLENYPDQVNTEWEISVNETTSVITITLEGGMSESFSPAGYDPDSRFLYATYQLNKGMEEAPISIGTPVYLGSAPFPSTAGWSLIGETTTPTPITLTTVTHVLSTFSDGRPSEESTDTTTTDTTYDKVETKYTRYYYLGMNEDKTSLLSRRDFMTLFTDGLISPTTTVTTDEEEIEPGIIKTTTTTVVADEVIPDRSYRIDNQSITLKTWGNTRIFIYGYGTGNPELDALFVSGVTDGEFIPFIPLRTRNRMVDEANFPDVYPWTKRAYKKATGSKIDTLLSSIEDNDDIDDVDFAYLVCGVALNTKDNDSRRYIYEFLQQLMLGQGNSGTEYTNWLQEWAAIDAIMDVWTTWWTAQSKPDDPLYGTEEPPYNYNYPPLPVSEIKSYSNAHRNKFSMRIIWNGMDETTGTGLKKPDAIPGDVWIEKKGYDEIDLWAYYAGSGDSGEGYGYVRSVAHKIEHIQIHWQTSANTWRTLDVWGLEHRNDVYNDQSVDTTAFKALEETDESGFIVPIHETVFKSLSLKASTQVATQCFFLVFNCYEIVKQKWYQTGLFKIVVIIIIVVISIFFPPAGGAAGGAGILGANAAVGAAVGLTGMAAIVAGAIINAIAAMIVMSIITKVATSLFGDKIGIIVATVASFIAMNPGLAGASSTQSIATSFSNLMSPVGLMKLSMAVGSGYTGYVNAETQEYLAETDRITREYEKQMKIISDAYETTFGYGQGVIDPMNLLDSTNIVQAAESSESFLTRTLMTGTDIAEISIGLISQFAETTTSTKLSIS